MDGHSFNASIARTGSARAPHLSFMMLKEYWFRELHLGLKVTASFDPLRIIHQSDRWSGKMHYARNQHGRSRTVKPQSSSWASSGTLPLAAFQCSKSCFLSLGETDLNALHLERFFTQYTCRKGTWGSKRGTEIYASNTPQCTRTLGHRGMLIPSWVTQESLALRCTR